MYFKRRLLLLPLLLMVASLACNAPFVVTETPRPAATVNTFLTSAAQTIQAVTTQSFPSSAPSATRTAALATSVPPTPTSSRTPAPVVFCDAATFVKDVTIPDGTIIGRSATFTKIWRIQNTGTCTWTTAYALVFVNGNQMSAPGGITMPSAVNPGQTIDLQVTMTAPSNDGQYQGFWKLRNAAGVLFGIGPQAQDAFWTDIKVTGPIYTAYDFAAHYCDAAWDSAANLPCPGTNGDINGFVLKLDHPTMENGQTMDQPGLLTVPSDVSNGFIRGNFPAFNVQTGDHFQSLINCQYKAYSCNVLFRLDYKIGSDDIKTIGQWNESYEGEYFPVDLDLSALAGQSVRFILTVTTNGPANQDYALWYIPRIIRVGTPPTFTPTFTPTSTSTSTPTSTPTFTPTSIPPLP